VGILLVNAHAPGGHMSGSQAVPRAFLRASVEPQNVQGAIEDIRIKRNTPHVVVIDPPISTAPLPTFLYGTAWKKQRTEALVQLALQQGFMGVDTANQPRHYFEAGVGAAVAAAIEAGTVSRSQLFLQTKFTHFNGQDPNDCPYDPRLPVAEQVATSFASSLEHLRIAFVDSYVLHGPSVGGPALAPADWEAWRAMERIHQTGAAKRLGISNVNLDQLQDLLSGAVVKPSFVQNRCYANTGWDARVRQLCKAEGITYQAFSVLTANWDAVRSPRVSAMARRLHATPEQVIFRFAHQVGMLPLTGTGDALHMHQDLAVLSPEMLLTEDEIGYIETGFMV